MSTYTAGQVAAALGRSKAWVARVLSAQVPAGAGDRKPSDSDSWCSPPEITVPLHDLYGEVDVDPCSNDRSLVAARLKLSRGGLVRPWVLVPRPMTRVVYQNDPYSQAAAWTAKMLHEIEVGHVRELVRLCMMSTSAHWWRDQCLKPKHNPRILGLQRIAFLDPDAPKAGMKRMSCRFEPALIYFGPSPRKFERTFAHLTRWSTWGRS